MAASNGNSPADAWFSVLFERDIFDDTVTFADAHICRSSGARSSSPSPPPFMALIFGFPTAYFIATRPERIARLWLFLITIPFWTNLLIRTFAIQEVIRNEGIVNTMLDQARHHLKRPCRSCSPTSPS